MKKSKRRDGYVLISPSGTILPGTFSPDRDATEGMAFVFLSGCYKSKWAAHPKYWRQWEKFCEAREKRGWRVVPACVVVA